MWIQLEKTQIENLIRLARGNQQLGEAEKLQHCLDLEQDQAQSLARYRRAAIALHGAEGQLEFDDDAVVSGGVGNGAYVMGWRWVPESDVQARAR